MLSISLAYFALSKSLLVCIHVRGFPVFDFEICVLNRQEGPDLPYSRPFCVHRFPIRFPIPVLSSLGPLNQIPILVQGALKGLAM